MKMMLNLDDVICMVNFDEVSEREVLALIKDDEVKFLEYEEIGELVFELVNKEDKFVSAYCEDDKITCKFIDEEFIIDLI